MRTINGKEAGLNEAAGIATLKADGRKVFYHEGSYEFVWTLRTPKEARDNLRLFRLAAQASAV